MVSKVGGVGATASPFVVVLVSILIARRIASLGYLIDERLAPVIAPVVFAGICVPLLCYCRKTRPAVSTYVGNGLVIGTAAALLTLVFMIILMSEANAMWMLLFQLFIAALSEEVVFRRALPNAAREGLQVLGLSTASATFVAIVLSQAMFAYAHRISLGPDYRLVNASELARLFAAGALYMLIVRNAGLAFAVAAHANINYGIASVHWSNTRVGAVLAIAVGAIGTFLLWVECHLGRGAEGRPTLKNTFLNGVAL